MELSGIPPPVMNWKSSNLPEQWEKFKDHVELIFTGPLKDKSEEEKVSYLLLWVGEEGRQVKKTWTGISEADAKKLDTFYSRFKTHVQPKLNPIFARYRFNNEIQGTDSIDAFVTRLRIRARDCNFRDVEMSNEMIRDRIVFGCTSPKVREKLINEGEKLTMDKAIQVVQNYEYCQEQLSSMAASTSNNVDAINKRPGGHSDNGKRRSGQSNSYRSGQQISRKLKNSPSVQCGNCGTCHSKNKCPAHDKLCHACGKKNHFSKMCRSTKTVHEISANNGANRFDSDCSEREYFIDTVSAHFASSSPDRAY